jgi:large subunit ribosomal protein L17
MCIIEFVDFNEAYTLGVTPAAPAAEAKPKTRRSRAKKTTDAVEDATVVKAPKAKAPKAAATKATAAKVAKKTNVGKKM